MKVVAMDRLVACFETVVARLGRLEHRLLRVVLAALIAFTAFEAWLLLLRSPLAEYRALQSVRLAAQGVDQAGSLDAEIERLAQRNAAQMRVLAAAAASGKVDEEEEVLALIETLGDLAVRHGLVLGRVNPAPRAARGGFEETGHTVEARGDYASLHRWFADARRALAPRVFAEIALRSADGGGRIALTARLARYRPAPAQPGSTQPPGNAG